MKPIKLIISTFIIWLLVYVSSEVFFHRQAKATLTDKTHCFQSSTHESNPNSMLYIAEECQFGMFLGNPLKTVVRVYSGDRLTVEYEAIFDDAPATDGITQWSCRSEPTNACELWVAVDNSLLSGGGRTERVIFTP
ncbi:MAG: hypothetical protein ACRCV6_10300 [Formosimonas sp.]